MSNRQPISTFLGIAAGLVLASTSVGQNILGPTGIALDLPNGRIYWANDTRGTIQRANLDGTRAQTLLSVGSPNLNGPEGLAIDLNDGKMYWAHWIDEIGRANLDGSGFEILLTSLGPRCVALDLVNSKLYWCAGSSQLIKRANLDGSGQETIVTAIVDPLAIALDVDGNAMYFNDRNFKIDAGKIERANLDGANRVTLIELGPATHRVRALALDLVNNKIYWSVGCCPSKIQRANLLDGSMIEDITEMAYGVVSLGIALDVPDGKVYWSEVGSQRIRRANLDGSAVETLITPCTLIDLNDDGTVNVLDLIDMLLCFGQPAAPGCESEDINGDGVVNVIDLIELLLAFGTTCLEEPPPPSNNLCANRLSIGDGSTLFTTISATTDGPVHATCQDDGQTYNDIWYNYVATCTGTFLVSTCLYPDGGGSSYATDLAVYDGCSCPVSDANLLGCDQINSSFCLIGNGARVEVPVLAGNCYKIRVGGFGPADAGTGQLSISCSP